MKSIKDGIIVVDNQNRVIEYNPSANSFLRGNDKIGKSIEFTFPELYNISKDITSGGKIEIQLNDNYYSVSLSEIIDKRNNVIGTTYYLNDISLQKQNEKTLKELSDTKSRLFTIITHDLKSPYQAMLGISELLETSDSDLSIEEKELLIKNLILAIKRSYGQLDSLIQWARIQNHNIIFKPIDNNLYGLILNAVEDTKENAKLKSINIEYSCPLDLHANIDEDILLIVLRNLIFNAIKYSHKNGKILINCWQDNSSIIITITDFGIGIPKNYIDKIFKFGETGSTKGTSGETGTGLGLIICKELIELHKGIIAVKSSVDNGATFTVQIPV